MNINNFKEGTREVKPELIRELFKTPENIINLCKNQLKWAKEDIENVLSKLITPEPGHFSSSNMQTKIDNLST